MKSAKRLDIQALRGIAVGLVVLDHLGLEPFRNGFLGVDVFFVISGFVIASKLSRDLDAGSFTFVDFYWSRAKRLLPAAMVTYLLTIFGAIWFLSALEMAGLTSQVIGALTFTANIVLWKQVDYFDIAAISKPLLHTWSLAVEEQYYIVFPALLLVVRRRYWLPVMAGLGVASLVACLWYVRIDRPAAFYLLPFRAWELLIGVVGALLYDRQWVRSKWMAIAAWPSLLILFAVGTTVQTGGYHPGGDAILICAATFVLLMQRDSPLKAKLVRPLVKLGDWSYSLYLVHWPIIVFATSAIMRDVSPFDLSIMLALSLLAAMGLHYSIELPIWKSKLPLSWGKIAAAVMASGALVAAQSASANYGPDIAEIAYANRRNVGLGEKCAYVRFEPRPECQTGTTPSIMVWGDSFAMHLVAGLVNETTKPVIQATRSSCAPFYDIAINAASAPDTAQAANGCADFNRSVIEYLKRMPSIKTVILAGNYESYFTGAPLWVRQPDGKMSLSKVDSDVVTRHFVRGLTAIGMKDRRVIVFGPPPPSRGACAERRSIGKIVIGANPNCATDRSWVDSKLARAKAFWVTVSKYAEEASFLPALCDERFCQTVIDGVPLYRDGAHLSYEGSKKALHAMNAKQYVE